MDRFKRPAPVADPESEAYWAGARRHELTILRCQGCRFYVHYPRERCPECLSTDLAPERVSGRGTVYSYTLVHRPLTPGFEGPLPYALVLVELEEQRGLRILSNLVDCPIERVRIGLPVTVVFEDFETHSLPLFRPAE
jgi:uncharacterized OB-fold protein